MASGDHPDVAPPPSAKRRRTTTTTPASDGSDGDNSDNGGGGAAPASSSSSSMSSWWHAPVAGAVSGVASRCVVYPADTVKAQLQVQGALPGGGPRYPGALAAARGAVRSGGGPAALYRGLGAVLLGVVPANAAYFGGYEGAKSVLEARRRRGGGEHEEEGGAGGGGAGGGRSNAARGDPSKPPPPPPPVLSLDDVVVGCAAQLLAGVVYTPVDIVKERLQVQSIVSGGNKGAADVLRGLLREGRGGVAGAAATTASSSRGSLRHLFRGYWATNAVWLPWNMLYVAGYEASKRAARGVLFADDHQGGGGEGGGEGGDRGAALPAWCVALCSASAAAAAAIVTHPADVVKTRLQVLPAGGCDTGAGAPSSPGRRPSAWRLARELVRAEGARALWSGLGARVANIAPGCALSWALYEQAMRALPAATAGA